MKKLVSKTSFPIYDTQIPCNILMGWEYEIDDPKIRTTDTWNRQINRIKTAFGPIGHELQFRCDGGHYNEKTRIMTHGIEVCSPVAPLFLLKHWATQLKPFTDKAKHHNGNHNNGGIHINISKTAFTAKQWPKVKEFLHNTKNYHLLFQLSDRQQQKFNLNAPQNLITCEFSKYGIITATKTYAYELRMFGAHSNTFLPALEFADALFRFAATVKIITPDGFFTWVDQHKKYQILSAYIHQKLADTK